MSLGPNSQLNRKSFLQLYGGVYENSAWVAEAVWNSGQASSGKPAIIAAMRSVVDSASRETQLALLRAHPDLAGRLAVQDQLTESSRAEQNAAGLSQCTPAEYEEFQRLNSAYRGKFGFPFILAVRGHDRQGILAEFRRRIRHNEATEFAEALQQVHRIARLRIDAL